VHNVNKTSYVLTNPEPPPAHLSFLKGVTLGDDTIPSVTTCLTDNLFTRHLDTFTPFPLQISFHFPKHDRNVHITFPFPVLCKSFCAVTSFFSHSSFLSVFMWKSEHRMIRCRKFISPMCDKCLDLLSRIW